MKTKKILYSGISIVAIVLILSSCDNLLNQQPKAQLSNATFWKTSSDAKLALAGVYKRLTDYSFFGYLRPELDVLTDNTFNPSTVGHLKRISRGNISPSTGGVINSMWSASYQGITTCNNFLQHIDNVNIDKAKKATYKAQAHFLRAYFYWNLLFFYGGVPIYKKVPTVKNVKRARSSASKVLSLIYQDLDYAITNLPNVPYTKGHAVKASAQGLEARVALYEHNYQKVVKLTKNIMNSGHFHLADNYKTIFLSSGQNNNPGIIFSSNYSLPNNYSKMDVQIGYFAQNQPTQNLVNSYYATDGEPIDKSPLYNSKKPYKNRDPRLNMSVFLPNETWTLSNGSHYKLGVGSSAGTYTGYYEEKYVDKANAPFSNSTRSGQNFVILRYADILLMYAEAENELNGPAPSIYDALDKIRKRVNMPSVKQGQSQEELRKTIRHERRDELAFEGLRYYDLKRWHIAQQVLNGKKDAAGATISFKKNNYLWPIPIHEMNTNPKLKQNPGY